MAFKKNPTTFKNRRRLPEREVLSRDRILDAVMTEIHTIKSRGIVAPYMDRDQKEAKRVSSRNEFIADLASHTERHRDRELTDDEQEEAMRVFDIVWNANIENMGFSDDTDKIVVPLKLLSKEQIRDMPKTSFSKREWVSLSAEDRAHIEGSSETAARRIVDLAETIELLYSDANERCEDYDTYDILEEFIRDNASFVAVPPDGDRYRGVKAVANAMSGEDTFQTLYDYAGERNVDYGEVTEKLAYALEDSGNWSVEIEEWDYQEGPGIVPIPKTIVIDHRTLRDLHNATQEELDAAFDIADVSNPESAGFGKELTAKLISKLVAVQTSEDAEFPVEPSHAAIITPNWDAIQEEIIEDINELAGEDADQFHSDGEPEPEEDRILYTFNDGSYAIRLIPEDLIPVGEELSQCTKDPEYNYGNKIKSGASALYSIRTKAGRPRITIEISLDDDGNPAAVEQIHGKGNRKVGWTKGVGVDKVRYMEVQQVGKVLELLGLTDYERGDIRAALGKAHDAMRELDPNMKFTRNPRRR